MYRRKSRRIRVGDIEIGGNAPVTVQSMISVPSTDVEGTVRQAIELEACGCELIRLAIPDYEAIALIPALKQAVSAPLIADIHFDYRLALAAVEMGIDKIRINPGNIGDHVRIKAVADACRGKNIPIRIGVNSGSIEKHILEKYGSPTAEAMVESALFHAQLLEDVHFDNIILSLKSSSVLGMLEAYRLAANACDYPLHLGVTESGTQHMGTIKSSIGIGSLLAEGIGDTIRVSLTDSPTEEVKVGKDILKALGLRKGVQLISCPTCGRTRIDLISLARKVEERLSACDKDVTVAVMGCVVNGPGEAREADIGIAGGDGVGVIFKKGKAIKQVPEDKLLETLLQEIENIAK